MKTCKKCGIEKDIKEFSKSLFGHRSDCKSCHNLQVQEWREKNKEKIKEYSQKYIKDGRVNYEKKRETNKLWQSQNLDKHRESSKRYYTKNAEKVKQANKSYHDRHPETRRTIKFNRRAREERAEGKIEKHEWLALCKKYNNTCLCCGRNDVKLTLDHVVPLVKGGTNTIDNAQPLCQSCNSKKHARIIDYRNGDLQ
jgi:5-methylcytosine-specific restriction endonuclease McrA